MIQDPNPQSIADRLLASKEGVGTISNAAATLIAHNLTGPRPPMFTIVRIINYLADTEQLKVTRVGKFLAIDITHPKQKEPK